MRKLDRLGWAAGLSYRAFGLRVGIRTNDPEILLRVEECAPLGFKPTSTQHVDVLFSIFKGGKGRRRGVKRFHLLYFYSTRILRTHSLDNIFRALENELKISSGLMARNRLFVHAGVVRWHGHAILMPGLSHSGKTSLVAALLRLGADYYSDEYALIDSKGRVHPYARPLAIRYRDGKAHKTREASAEEFGRRPGVKPLPIGLVVVTNFKPGATWRPRRLTPARASLAVLEHCMAARRQPGNIMHILKGALRSALVLKGARGEADEVAPRILQRLDEHLADRSKQPAHSGASAAS